MQPPTQPEPGAGGPVPAPRGDTRTPRPQRSDPRGGRPSHRARVLVAVAVAVAATVAAAVAAGGKFAVDANPGPGDGPPATHAAQPAAAPAAQAAQAPARRFRLVASGDMLPHSPLVRRAGKYAGGDGYDFRPMLEPVRPFVQGADLAVCHLETPVDRDGDNLKGYPAFNAPPQLAQAIAWAGYDACSTASNHSLDQGAAGVTTTLDVLDAAGIRHAGMARTPADATRPTIVEAAGVRVALLSYTYGTNTGGIAGKPWLVNQIDPGRILAEARAARAAGAEYVVAFLHWGEEYRTAPTASQRQVATTLLAAPEIDLILGHHAHVVQPIERVTGKWVAFGMGNLLSNQTSRCCGPGAQDGVLVEVTVAGPAGKLAVERIAYVPTWVERPSYRVLPTTNLDTGEPLADPNLRASAERTRRAVGPQVTTVRAPATPASQQQGQGHQQQEQQQD